MQDKTVGVSITLYKSQVEQVETFLNKSKKYKSVAAFFQYLVDDFFKKHNRVNAKNFMLFIGYPMIFAAVMLYVAITAQKVNKQLTEAFLVTDLLVYGQIYYVIGFAWLGILIAGFVYLLTEKKKDR